MQPEATEAFECFGARCAVIVSGSGPAGSAAEAAARAKARLLEWHQQFSRFEASSELSRLNADPRTTVPVSAMMVRFLEAALAASAASGGLVDATLASEIEAAGYASHFDGVSVPLAAALARAPVRAPGRPSPRARWREVSVDRIAGTVTRPAGVRFDSGGIAKGLFGDVLAEVLEGHESFAVDLGGDVRLGGSGGLRRPVQVASPFGEELVHTFELARGAVATSGIGKRSWLGADGRPAHHLLDPSSGRPAFTGVVQVTALAPSAVEAETLTKAALLSGPREAARRLRHGGVIVHDDASVDVL
jgi:thiamine biosynthesis lipoprotein